MASCSRPSSAAPRGLIGRHQAANAAVALGILAAIDGGRSAAVPEDAISTGLPRRSAPGRMELLEVAPDGAVHRAAAVVRRLRPPARRRPQRGRCRGARGEPGRPGRSSCPGPRRRCCSAPSATSSGTDGGGAPARRRSSGRARPRGERPGHGPCRSAQTRSPRSWRSMGSRRGSACADSDRTGFEWGSSARAGGRRPAHRRGVALPGRRGAWHSSLAIHRPQAPDGARETVDATPSFDLPADAAAASPIAHPPRSRVRDTRFGWTERTFVMGIVNVTPDSFSGDGLLRTARRSVDSAVAQAVAMADEGADLLDVGGESTRPGHAPVSEDEELRAYDPVIRPLAPPFRRAHQHRHDQAGASPRLRSTPGADLVNDVWGVAPVRRDGASRGRAGRSRTWSCTTATSRATAASSPR